MRFGREQAEIFHCNGMLKATKKSFLCYNQNIFRLRPLIVLYSPWGAVGVVGSYSIWDLYGQPGNGNRLEC